MLGAVLRGTAAVSVSLPGSSLLPAGVQQQEARALARVDAKVQAAGPPVSVLFSCIAPSGLPLTAETRATRTPATARSDATWTSTRARKRRGVSVLWEAAKEQHAGEHQTARPWRKRT